MVIRAAGVVVLRFLPRSGECREGLEGEARSMPDETTQEWWQAWLTAEIARCEGELLAAPPHQKIDIWRRLDLLHALEDNRPVEDALVGGGRPAFRRWVADGLLFGGAMALGAALVWFLGGELGLAI
jgi:hypothetical protein